MCDQGAWETEQHVLISCPKYTQEREIALSELEKVWGPARLHSWKSKGDLERAAEWLASGRAERKDERETDGVLKKFLTEIEGIRVKAGAAEMTGYETDGQGEDESKEEDLDEDLLRSGLRATGRSEEESESDGTQSD